MESEHDNRRKLEYLEDWLTGHFRGLKTYASGGDPRKYIFPSLLMKYVTSALLQSETLSEDLKGVLKKKLKGYNCMQTGHQDIFDDQIPSDENRLLNLYPVVWMVGILSGYGNEDIIELLELTDADIEKKEAETTNQEVIEIY